MGTGAEVLYIIKTKYIPKLILYLPKNERERAIHEKILAKLRYMRRKELVSFSFMLREALQDDAVSEDLKRLYRELLQELSEMAGKAQGEGA